MPFGKHRGAPLRDLPNDYLDWLLGLDDLREPFRSRVEAEANRRRGYREPERPMAGPVDGNTASAIIEAGRRALALKHHPDRGGDVRSMQAVNDTADRLLGQLPRRRSAA
jgi:hypothetical protein